MNHVLKYWTGHDSHILFVTFSEIQFASKQHDIIFSFISLQLGSLLQKIMHDEGEFICSFMKSPHMYLNQALTSFQHFWAIIFLVIIPWVLFPKKFENVGTIRG